MKNISALLFVSCVAAPALVLAAQGVQHTPRGTATDITKVLPAGYAAK